MDIRTALIRDVERYIERTGATATAFGERVALDGGFLRRLRAGKDIRTEKLQRVRAFLDANPDSLPPAKSKRRSDAERRPS